MRRSTAVTACVAAVLALGACGEEEEPAAVLPPVAGLDAAGCSPMTYGGDGRPDVLVAAIFTLQGPFFDHGLQDSQALRLVFQERGWRAGSRRVAYQVCDETTATSEVADGPTCRRHARNFAGHRGVLVVIGPVMSSCAGEMLPILNGARGGPLALVSPSNTYLGLTRRGAGVGKGEPERYASAGRRSYVRLAPADDLQGAAAAMVANRARARRVYALNDGDGFGRGAADAFAEAADRLGLVVAGAQRWDGKARSYRRLARRVARARPGAVYLGGYITSNAARLVEDLRRELGPGLLILGPDGLQPSGLIENAGAAAEGVVTTIGVVPNRMLPPAGRAFAARFERRFGQKPCCYSVHAGEVARVVLDAIAASDGTRAGVLDRLFATKVRGGYLGDFAIDRYGDTTLGKMGIYRITDGRSRFQTAVSPAQELLARR